jgi:hypothetical protein
MDAAHLAIAGNGCKGADWSRPLALLAVDSASLLQPARATPMHRVTMETT